MTHPAALALSAALCGIAVAAVVLGLIRVLRHAFAGWHGDERAEADDWRSGRQNAPGDVP